MTEIALQGAGVMPLVGQREPARMVQHMGVNLEVQNGSVGVEAGRRPYQAGSSNHYLMVKTASVRRPKNLSSEF